MDKLYLDMMKNLLGDDYDKYIKSMVLEPKRGIRSIIDNNLDKEKLPYGINEYVLKTDEKLGNSVIHHLGGIYLQEPSAMAPVNLIDFKDDYICLDMCASPGGKSGQIAERIPNGILVSNEIDKKRSQILYSNIERMGYDNVIVLNNDPKDLVENLSNTFDVILIDAPCSGEGMFRKDCDAVNMWNIGNVNSCSTRDLLLLEYANKMLKKNGIIIYSTCTFSYEEDEYPIIEFMKKHDYSVIKPNSKVLECGSKGLIDGAVRMYPHNSYGEGQFMCAIKKNEENDAFTSKFKPTKLDGQELKLVNSFIDENTTGLKLNLIKRNNDIYHLISNDINLKGLNVISYGVHIGEIDKRFIPNHHFFKVFGKYFNNILELDINDERLTKYIHGEQLDIDFLKGYGVLKVSGLILGGFKSSDGVLKNLYPKGLRSF